MKARMRHSILSVLLVMVMFKATLAPPIPYPVYGIVYQDEGEQPLSGVAVEMTNLRSSEWWGTFHTGEDGAYLLDLSNFPGEDPWLEGDLIRVDLEFGEYFRQYTFTVSWSEWDQGGHSENVVMDTVPFEHLPLDPGWQWVSTAVYPDPAAIEDIFPDCWNSLDIIVACDGSFCIPGIGCWISGWNFSEMYKIHMADVCTVRVRGWKVPTDTLILLDQGWNCITYLPECSLEPETALVTIWDRLNIVKNDDGDFCIPEYGLCWIDYMEYHEGYKIHLSAPDTLIYPTNCPPCPPPLKAFQNDRLRIKGTHFTQIKKTGGSYVIVVNSVDIDGEPPELGDEIGVLTASGLCVGAQPWNDGPLGVVTWRDDPLTDFQDGFNPGEGIQFLLWDKNQNKEIKLFASYVRGDGFFDTGPFASVRLTADSEEEVSQQKVMAHQNYPNPFNPGTKISYALPEACHVRLTIYNVMGQRIRVLIDEHQTPALKEVYWDGKDASGREVASGIYFYKIEAGKFKQSKKMLILK